MAKHSFRKAMETYDALAKLQEEDPRLRIHAISTATHVNIDEIRTLTTYLYDRCPKMDHHNLAIIRGDRKHKSLVGPGFQPYLRLYEYIRRLWSPRETGRYGASVEPMLQWAKAVQPERDRYSAGRTSAPVPEGAATPQYHAADELPCSARCRNSGRVQEHTAPVLDGEYQGQRALLIRAEEPLAVGDGIFFSFFLPNGTHVTGYGEISRIEQQDAATHAYLYGVKFTNIAPNVRSASEAAAKLAGT